ncbi:MAG: ECF-type sigma factor [Rhodothermales bacterium]
MQEPGTITRWLRRLQEGDTSAFDKLIPLLYDELHLIAKQRLRNERQNHTLGATALVNEVYLKFVNQKQLDLADRKEFMAIASTAMRNILVDYARTKKRVKRGGGQANIPLEDVDAFLSDREAEEVLLLDEALARLANIDERASQVVQYRFFGGLTLEETAEVMGISKRSVQRSWTTAKAWLRKEVAGEISI